jgi:hypothetical protein
MEIEQIWRRIENWLTQHAPAALQALGPGLTEAQISQAESKLGIMLPKDLRESLSIHNGMLTIEDYTTLLPLDGTASVISFRELFPKIISRLSVKKERLIPFALEAKWETETDNLQLTDKRVFVLDTTNAQANVMVWEFRADITNGRFEIVMEQWKNRDDTYLSLLERLANELEANVFVVGEDGKLIRRATLERYRQIAAATLAHNSFVPPSNELGSPFPTKLMWEDLYKSWCGKYRDGSKTVSISLKPDFFAPFEMQSFVEQSYKFFSDWRGREPEIRKTAADHLLDVYNYEWRGRNPELDATEFTSKLKLKSIDINGDGSAIAYYSCGRLFRGHYIEIRLDGSDKVSEVGIIG